LHPRGAGKYSSASIEEELAVELGVVAAEQRCGRKNGTKAAACPVDELPASRVEVFDVNKLA
jgi:hypothetical protein